jgi:hypothetical protein
MRSGVFDILLALTTLPPPKVCPAAFDGADTAVVMNVEAERRPETGERWGTGAPRNS